MLSNQTPIERVRQQSRGRWIEILAAAGIPIEHLDGKGHPCPKCGGRDRFAAFRDVAATGGVHCRHCFTKGADGIETVKWLLGCRLPAAMDFILQQLGTLPEKIPELKPDTEKIPEQQLGTLGEKVPQASPCHPEEFFPQGRKGQEKNPYLIGSGKNTTTYPSDIVEKIPRCEKTAEAAIAHLERTMAARGFRLSRTWEYHDQAGRVVAYVVRFDGPDGKTFRPVSLHMDGWRLSDPPGPWPLFGLGQLPTDLVFAVEGEKCVGLMRSLGLVAVTSAHGSSAAHKTDWSPLRNVARVVILPDADEPGRKYAATVAGIVAELGVDVAIVEIPGIPPGGDIVDWIAARDDQRPESLRAELLELVDRLDVGIPISKTSDPNLGIPRKDGDGLTIGIPIVNRRPKLIRLADVEPEAVDWLWPGRIALGKLTLLSGDPGLGKSFLTIDLAARVTTGKAWPDRPGELNAIGSVVMLSAEDDLADTIRPRLDAAGADVSRVWCLQAVRYRLEDDPEEIERGFCLTTDCEVLEATLQQVGDCRLLVVDPIGSYLAGIDSHRNAEVRSVLQPLSDLAARYGVAVLAVSHLNKANGTPAVYRSMGSLAFTAAARAVWCVSRDPDCSPRRLVLPVKNNLGADESGLAYRIAGDPPTVDWEAATVAMTADDALAPTEEREAKSEREVAKAWLHEMLAQGPVAASDLVADAKEHGIAEKTLRRAYRDIGGKPQKASLKGGWFWSMPAEDGH